MATSLAIYVNTVTVMNTVRSNVFNSRSVLFTGTVLSFIVILVVTTSLNGNYKFTTVPIKVLRKAIALFDRLLGPIVAATIVGGVSCINSVLVFYIKIGLF